MTQTPQQSHRKYESAAPLPEFPTRQPPLLEGSGSCAADAPLKSEVVGEPVSAAEDEVEPFPELIPDAPPLEVSGSSPPSPVAGTQGGTSPPGAATNSMSAQL